MSKGQGRVHAFAGCKVVWCFVVALVAFMRCFDSSIGVAGIARSALVSPLVVFTLLASSSDKQKSGAKWDWKKGRRTRNQYCQTRFGSPVTEHLSGNFVLLHMVR
eukprot:scaffold2120_cov169-Amphora_coffeaeformis.AAC.1